MTEGSISWLRLGYIINWHRLQRRAVPAVSLQDVKHIHQCLFIEGEISERTKLVSGQLNGLSEPLRLIEHIWFRLIQSRPFLPICTLKRLFPQTTEALLLKWPSTPMTWFLYARVLCNQLLCRPTLSGRKRWRGWPPVLQTIAIFTLRNEVRRLARITWLSFLQFRSFWLTAVYIIIGDDYELIDANNCVNQRRATYLTPDWKLFGDQMSFLQQWSRIHLSL